MMSETEIIDYILKRDELSAMCCALSDFVKEKHKKLVSRTAFIVMVDCANEFDWLIVPFGLMLMEIQNVSNISDVDFHKIMDAYDWVNIVETVRCKH